MIQPLAISFFVIVAVAMVAEALLNRGRVTGQAIGAAGGTYTTDILTNDRHTLIVQCEMTGAAAGDLAVTVTAFEDDNTTLATAMNLPVVRAPATNPAFSTTVKWYAQYEVSGIEKVRITVTNNNVGAQTINRLSWRLTDN